MNNKSTLHPITWLIALIIILTACTPQNASGRILFLSPSSSGDHLYMIDAEGNQLEFLGTVIEPVAWSRNGKYIATGCLDWSDIPASKKFCIYDAATIRYGQTFPKPNYPLVIGMNIVQKFDIPEKCIHPEQPDMYTIRSFSWSPDNKKLAIGCMKQVCILELETGNLQCWDDAYGQFVYRANWSPVEDLLVVSGEGQENQKIYLVKPDGTDPVYLADGWSGDWSPDGQQIAFIQSIPSRDPELFGETILSASRKDGSEYKILYQNPLDDSGHYNPQSFLRLQCVDGSRDDCRVSWSPDGQYIAFVAQYGEGSDSHILRLDLKTHEVIFLVFRYGMEFDRFDEVDWGP